MNALSKSIVNLDYVFVRGATKDKGEKVQSPKRLKSGPGRIEEEKGTVPYTPEMRCRSDQS